MLATKTTKATTMATCSSPSTSSKLIPPRTRAAAPPARATAAAASSSSRSMPGTTRSPFASPSPRRRSPVVALASSTAPSSSLASAASAEVQASISTLKRAARRAWAVPASETLAAILALEKAKLIPDKDNGDGNDSAWLEAIAGGPQGRRWRLMFTSGTDQVRKAVAGDRSGGVYIPITAVQRWRLGDRLIENGIYLGFLGAFVFSGRWEAKGRRLSFDFDSVRLRVGPWSKDFAVKKGKKAEEEEEEAKGKKKSLGPFFLFAYADDDICVARGRSGGVALWARASGDWQVKAGIDA